MARLKIESRHSDYGPDAGGYSVLRFDGEWVGRVDKWEAGKQLVGYVSSMEQKVQLLEEVLQRLPSLAVADAYERARAGIFAWPVQKMDKDEVR